MSKHRPAGFFGGTFNPMHQGHIVPAIHVAEVLDLERVHMTPVNMPSHRAAPGVTGAMRLDMVCLAIDDAGSDALVADRRELDREGPSYTFDSLAELRAEYGDETPLVLILGMDSFVSLPTWYRWEELFDFAHIAVMRRPGSNSPDPLPSWWQAHLSDDLSVISTRPAGHIIHIDTPELAISSTLIRRRLSEGDIPSDWLAPGVVEYIKSQGLYGIEASGAPLPASVSSVVSSSVDAKSGSRQPEITQASAQSKSTPTTVDDDEAYVLRVRDVVYESMDDAKAKDISSLDVRGMTDVTDFMMIATGTSDRHLRAVAENIKTGLREAGYKPVGSEGDDGGDWILIDCGPVIAHVMRRETRDYYDLDGLWSRKFVNLYGQSAMVRSKTIATDASPASQALVKCGNSNRPTA